MDRHQATLDLEPGRGQYHVAGTDDDGNLYFVLSRVDSSTQSAERNLDVRYPAVLVRVDPDGSTERIHTVSDDKEVRLLTVTGNHLVWAEYTMYGMEAVDPVYYVMSRDSGGIQTFSVPDTGSDPIWNGEVHSILPQDRPVVIEDRVYLVIYRSIAAPGAMEPSFVRTMIPDIYTYDIRSGQLVLFKEGAQFPFICDGEAGWITIERDVLDPAANWSCTVESESRGQISVVPSLNPNLSTIRDGTLAVGEFIHSWEIVADGEICTSDKETVDGSALYVIRDDIRLPVIMGRNGNYVGSPVLAGDALAFTVLSGIAPPRFFDIRQNALVNLPVPPDCYTALQGDNSLTFVVSAIGEFEEGGSQASSAVIALQDQESKCAETGDYKPYWAIYFNETGEDVMVVWYTLYVP